MLFTWNGKEKDAPTFKVPVTAHPKDGKGNIGKKKVCNIGVTSLT